MSTSLADGKSIEIDFLGRTKLRHFVQFDLTLSNKNESRQNRVTWTSYQFIIRIRVASHEWSDKLEKMNAPCF